MAFGIGIIPQNTCIDLPKNPKNTLPDTALVASPFHVYRVSATPRRVLRLTPLAGGKES